MTPGREPLPAKKRFSNPRAEEMRVRAHYRQYAMTADAAFPEEALRGLIGPDCNYRLYGRLYRKARRAGADKEK